MSTVDASDRQPGAKKTKNFWWLIPLPVLVLAVRGVSVMRIRYKNSEQAVVIKTAPLNVCTVAAQKSPIRNWVSSEGTVRVVSFKHLAFDVDGEVTYIGDRVTKGELLAQIDDLELQAEAAITEAREHKSSYRSEVAQAQLNQVKAARNFSQSELTRYQQIFNQGAISTSDIDSRNNDLLNVDAQVQSVEAQIISAQAQIGTAEAQVKAAQDRLRAGNTRITTAQSQPSFSQS